MSVAKPVKGAKVGRNLVYVSGPDLKVGPAGEPVAPGRLFGAVSRGDARRLRKAISRAGYGGVARHQRTTPANSVA